jgi:porphobilinogen synthase
MKFVGQFPTYRPRRLRTSAALRRLVSETQLDAARLVLPLFVRGGRKIRRPIQAMPGVFQLSPDELVREATQAHALGVPAILLFGIPDKKDAKATGAYARNGIVQQAVRLLKKELPGLMVITDVCLCEYMEHGHCGIVHQTKTGAKILNDPTLKLLAQTAASHVEAGADIVAPSDMMDGRVAAIRKGLDTARLSNTPILSYASKFASAFYGPFREAADSAPQFGDRRSYQMDGANAREAMREIELDLGEGADMILMKPAMPYLDIVRAARDRFDVPMGAYQVSGEYSMLHAAFQRGWLDQNRAMLESLVGIRRAGADFIVTYFAKDAAKLLG